MANNLTNNPWILDSTGVVTTDMIRVKGIRWTGAGSGNTVILKDAAGHVVWNSVGNAANYVEADGISFTPGLNWNGLTVDTIAAGVLLVELL